MAQINLCLSLSRHSKRFGEQEKLPPRSQRLTRQEDNGMGEKPKYYVPLQQTALHTLIHLKGSKCIQVQYNQLRPIKLSISHNRKGMKDPQSIKSKTTIWPSNCTFEYISKANENRISQRYLHPHVYCSIIHNSQGIEAPKCLSTDEGIKMRWFLHTMEYYSAMRKNRILPFATTWMNLEGLMLSEISQRKTNTIYHCLHSPSKKNKTN